MSDPEVYEPVETQTTLEVGLVRTVRFGPIMIASAILFSVIAIVVSLLFPVLEDAEYTAAQAAGFMALVGAAAGLTIGAILCLILSAVARRRKGAAIAVRTDVK